MGKIENITATGLFATGMGLIMGAVNLFTATPPDYTTGAGLLVVGFGIIGMAVYLVQHNVIESVKKLKA